ncbi:MAG: DUF1844 domain-containing protein [Deltaproteobacteria bacterium]|nr:DUF1844 domain-containing protein [Deltaproteobacteria bacterium]
MEEKEARKPAEAAKGPGDEKTSETVPPLDFSTFILSLSTSVLMNLGLIENPVTKKTEEEPEVAKQTIDLISLLQEKTKGNLSEQESRLIEDMLHELRLLYVKSAQ